METGTRTEQEQQSERSDVWQTEEPGDTSSHSGLDSYLQELPATLEPRALETKLGALWPQAKVHGLNKCPEAYTTPAPKQGGGSQAEDLCAQPSVLHQTESQTQLEPARSTNISCACYGEIPGGNKGGYPEGITSKDCFSRSAVCPRGQGLEAASYEVDGWSYSRHPRPRRAKESASCRRPSRKRAANVALNRINAYRQLRLALSVACDSEHLKAKHAKAAESSASCDGRAANPSQMKGWGP